MKNSTIPAAQMESARAAIEKLEQAFGVRSNVRAGTPPAHAAAWDHAQGQPFEPQIIPLYGVIVYDGT